MTGVNTITSQAVKINNGFYFLSIGSQAEQGVIHEIEDKNSTLDGEKVSQD